MLSLQTYGHMISPSPFYIMPVMENGEKSKSELRYLESQCWWIHDIYLKVYVSIIICHEDLHSS